MKDTDFQRLIELTVCGGGFMAANDNAQALLDQSSSGEVLAFMEMTSRDINFHRAYFSLIGYIWDWLTPTFKNQIPRNKFYVFLKYLRKEYDVMFRFQDGTTWCELKSIAFGKMSQAKFEEYVKHQLPDIYTEVICVLFPDKKQSDNIIASIEDEYHRFLQKL